MNKILKLYTVEPRMNIKFYFLMTSTLKQIYQLSDSNLILRHNDTLRRTNQKRHEKCI